MIIPKRNKLNGINTCGSAISSWTFLTQSLHLFNHHTTFPTIIKTQHRTLILPSTLEQLTPQLSPSLPILFFLWYVPGTGTSWLGISLTTENCCNLHISSHSTVTDSCYSSPTYSTMIWWCILSKVLTELIPLYIHWISGITSLSLLLKSIEAIDQGLANYSLWVISVAIFKNKFTGTQLCPFT